MDAAASLSHDSQATLILPEANASGPSGFSMTHQVRSGSQDQPRAQRLTTSHPRNSTKWIFVALAILGLAGLFGYFMLSVNEPEGSGNAKPSTTASNETPSSTPTVGTTPQREIVHTDAQPTPIAMTTAPRVESSTPQTDQPNVETGEAPQANISSTGSASSDQSERPREEGRRVIEPGNDIGKSRGNGSFEITIENAWVSRKSGSFNFCGYRASEEQRALFVRFTIRALSESLPNTRTEDFLLVDNRGRRIETTCGDGRFYPHSFTGEKQKTITLVYIVPRDFQHLTFRFQRVGYGDAIAFDLGGIE